MPRWWAQVPGVLRTQNKLRRVRQDAWPQASERGISMPRNFRFELPKVNSGTLRRVEDLRQRRQFCAKLFMP